MQDDHISGGPNALEVYALTFGKPIARARGPVLDNVEHGVTSQSAAFPLEFADLLRVEILLEDRSSLARTIEPIAQERGAFVLLPAFSANSAGDTVHMQLAARFRAYPEGGDDDGGGRPTKLLRGWCVPSRMWATHGAQLLIAAGAQLIPAPDIADNHNGRWSPRMKEASAAPMLVDLPDLSLDALSPQVWAMLQHFSRGEATYWTGASYPDEAAFLADVAQFQQLLPIAQKEATGAEGWLRGAVSVSSHLVAAPGRFAVNYCETPPTHRSAIIDPEGAPQLRDAPGMEEGLEAWRELVARTAPPTADFTFRRTMCVGWTDRRAPELIEKLATAIAHGLHAPSAEPEAPDGDDKIMVLKSPIADDGAFESVKGAIELPPRATGYLGAGKARSAPQQSGAPQADSLVDDLHFRQVAPDDIDAPQFRPQITEVFSRICDAATTFHSAKTHPDSITTVCLSFDSAYFSKPVDLCLASEKFFSKKMALIQATSEIRKLRSDEERLFNLMMSAVFFFGWVREGKKLGAAEHALNFPWNLFDIFFEAFYAVLARDHSLLQLLNAPQKCLRFIETSVDEMAGPVDAPKQGGRTGSIVKLLQRMQDFATAPGMNDFHLRDQLERVRALISAKIRV
ncbi:MAG: hypothetical protein MRY74_14585 [Neomegalonema sp.]|nr:hypothetical protein [Neomegalonema sp.]